MPDTPRAWRTVLDKIEADLVSGALHPGDRLPGERQLAAELGVGRSSVREAIRVLDAMGLVTTNVGSGPQAGAIIVSRPDGGMSTLMRLQVAATGFAVDDIVSARVLMETAVVTSLASRFAQPGSLSAPPIIGARPAKDHYFGQVISQATQTEPATLSTQTPKATAATAATAATISPATDAADSHATADSSGSADPQGTADPDGTDSSPTGITATQSALADAARILDAMDAVTAPAEFLALDTRFHLSLAEAAGNQVIVATMAGLRSAVESYVTEGIPAFADWQSTAHRLQHEHRNIVDSIRAGDQPLAGHLVRRHIEDYFADITRRRSDSSIEPTAHHPH